MERSELASEVVRLAVAAGATAADVLLRDGTEFCASVRLGSVESLTQSTFQKLGLRLFAGCRSALSSTSDFSAAGLRSSVASTLQMARLAPEDSFAALPPEEEYAREVPPLQLCFRSEMGIDERIALARRCEQAALDHHGRIRNSEGARYTDSEVHVTYANSFGICRTYARSAASLSATPIASADGQMQRDYWVSAHLDARRLAPPEEVGARAASRSLRRLGARKIATCEVPVVFDPLTSASIVKHLADAASGTALLRKASFFADRMGTRIGSAAVSLLDDPLLEYGIGSRPFDAEGLPGRPVAVVRDGVLESYLLDSYSARKLGLKSTGSANRDPQGSPSCGPSNFFLRTGSASPGELIASVRRGLYVTELVGFGVNIVSGNYSQGAVGLWIENGELAFPVEEVTVAGNLNEMLFAIEGVCSDPVPVTEVFAPTLMIGKMVVSGN